MEEHADCTREVLKAVYLPFYVPSKGIGTHRKHTFEAEGLTPFTHPPLCKELWYHIAESRKMFRSQNNSNLPQLKMFSLTDKVRIVHRYLQT